MAIVHAALDTAIIADCEQFVPMNTGTLTRSVMTHSKPGKLIWKTQGKKIDYAWIQYYGRLNTNGTRTGIPFKNYTTLHHKNPGPMWVERAKPVWMKRWLEIFFKLLTGQVDPGSIT
jgi:hypothetical protein